jgi:uncharacterized protein (DUF342 family)
MAGLAKQRKDKAIGAKDQISKRLKEEFEIGSILEARKLKDTLTSQLEKTEKRLEKLNEQFEDKWADEIASLENDDE